MMICAIALRLAYSLHCHPALAASSTAAVRCANVALQPDVYHHYRGLPDVVIADTSLTAPMSRETWNLEKSSVMGFRR